MGNPPPKGPPVQKDAPIDDDDDDDDDDSNENRPQGPQISRGSPVVARVIQRHSAPNRGRGGSIRGGSGRGGGHIMTMDGAWDDSDGTMNDSPPVFRL